MAFRRAVVETPHRHPAGSPRQDPSPQLEGEELDFTATVGEVVARRPGGTDRKLGCAARRGGEGSEMGQTERRGFAGSRRTRGAEGLGNVGPRADASLDEPLSQELLVRQHHHGAGHTQLFGQVTGGRKPFSSAQRAVEHGASQPAVDLAEQGLAGLREWYQKLHD